jgi:hypothetical protein
VLIERRRDLVERKQQSARAWLDRELGVKLQSGRRRAINDRAIFDSDQILQMLGMTEQPGDTPGTCRYCGCTDNFGCGDCEWVDGDATICSACI